MCLCVSVCVQPVCVEGGGAGERQPLVQPRKSESRQWSVFIYIIKNIQVYNIIYNIKYKINI